MPVVSRRYQENWGNFSKIELPVMPEEGARHVVVDPTGVKVSGEGEGKTRQH